MMGLNFELNLKYHVYYDTLCNGRLKYLILVSLCIETARQSDWDGIIACHRGFLVATTWNYQKGSIGAHKLEPERFNRNRALSVHATVSVLIRSLTVF